MNMLRGHFRRKEIKAGAKFFQTQAVYVLNVFEKFMKEAEKFKVPILGGIVLLKSAGMAKYMNENVAGVTVPERYIKMMAKDIFSVNPKYIKLVTFGLLVHEMTHFYVWGHEDDFLKVAINIFNCLLYDFRKEITEITLEDAIKTWEEIVEKG